MYVRRGDKSNSRYYQTESKMKTFYKIKQWYNNTLQIHREIYESTHGIRKNREAKRRLKKLK